MRYIKQPEETQEGDYYGTIYKGPMLPLLVGVVLVIGLLWYFIKRKPSN